MSSDSDHTANSLERSNLDPRDWDDFRDQAHRLLDICVDRMATAQDYPWQAVPTETLSTYQLGNDPDPHGFNGIVESLSRDILPYNTGNTHPRFFGWVHGTGLAVGLMSEMVAATMNSNCGGRDHAAIYIERAVIDWCRESFGFPATTSGLLVTGTSQATIIALAVARHRALGPDSRQNGLRNTAALTAYAVAGAHNATVKALELLGLGSSALRTIPQDAEGCMDMNALATLVEQDRRAGAQPFCVIGTAGSVDLGLFDRLDLLADYCSQENLWLHVDGAFGVWTHLAAAPWSNLTKGLGRADSLAFDFHKWMYVQYDCGAVLIRDESAHRAAFASRPAYLSGQNRGLAGGDPWYCDYGTDLSRGFRALKVWSALKTHGKQAFSDAITKNCEHAELMGRLVQTSENLSLTRSVRSNVCCFRAIAPTLDKSDTDDLQNQIAQELQLNGSAVFSTTHIAGRTVLRAAIVNHRTAEADIRTAISQVEQVRHKLVAEWSNQ